MSPKNYRTWDKVMTYQTQVPSMQSTGLKDKDGREIFELDLLSSMEGRCVSLVEWDDRGGWTLRTIKHPFLTNHVFKMFASDNGFKDYKVIGNQFENPEL